MPIRCVVWWMLCVDEYVCVYVNEENTQQRTDDVGAGGEDEVDGRLRGGILQGLVQDLERALRGVAVSVGRPWCVYCVWESVGCGRGLQGRSGFMYGCMHADG